jgi:hypothetical protein
MVGIKRSHDTTLAGDVALSAHPEDAYTQPQSAQPDGDADSPLYKKSKFSSATSDTLDEMTDRYVRSEQASVLAHVGEAISDVILGREDADMNRATAEAENADMSDATPVAEDGDMSDATLQVKDKTLQPSREPRPRRLKL